MIGVYGSGSGGTELFNISDYWNFGNPIYVGAEYFLNNKFIIAAVTPRKLLDVSKLNSLGWKAQIDLEDGIKTTYEWFCEKHGEF